MATTYGSTASYGLASESANGLYIGDLSLDVSVEEALVPNHIGDDIAVSLFNEQGTLTASGVLATADAATWKYDLAKEPTLAAGNSAIFANVTTILEFWVQSLNLRRANREHQTGSWTANGRPGITSITASA